MSDRVRHVNATARKSLCDRTAAFGRRLAVDSRTLATAGVRTPTADYDGASHELVFPWIDGDTARVWFRRRRKAWSAGEWNRNKYELKVLLEPLIAMHECSRQGLTLEPLDPWRRIRPRLTAPPVTKGFAEHNTWAWLLYRELQGIALRWNAPLLSRGQVPVHGDFHVGQLMLEAATDASWLIDLEDMVAGRPESDVANLTAHWVTSRDLYQGDVLKAFNDLGGLLIELYQDMGGRPLQSLGMRFYGATALLRRALKLGEREAEVAQVGSILRSVETLVNAMKRHQIR